MSSKQRILRRPHQVATLCLVLGLSIAAAAAAQGNFDRGNGSAAISSQSDLESLRQWVESQGFGQGFQWTAINSADFVPFHPDLDWARDFTTGSIEQVSTLDTPVFVAPLSLPNGAVIEFVCLVSEDNDPSGNNVGWIRAVEHDPDPQIVFSAAAFTGQPDTPGWSGICTTQLGIPYRSFADFDSDGVDGDVFYWLEMGMTQGAVLKKVAGMVVLWRRQMSPPPATPTFDDVPANHPLYQHIEAIAASGVTQGCPDPNNFCPNGVLTRGQIVALLSEALGLHWPN